MRMRIKVSSLLYKLSICRIFSLRFYFFLVSIGDKIYNSECYQTIGYQETARRKITATLNCIRILKKKRRPTTNFKSPTPMGNLRDKIKLENQGLYSILCRDRVFIESTNLRISGR